MNMHRMPVVLGLVVVGMITAVPAGAAIVVDPISTPWIAGSGDVVNDTSLDIANDATAEIRPGASVTLTGSVTVGLRSDPGALSQLIASGGTVNAAALVVANKSEGDAYVELSGADITVANVNVGSSVSELAGVNSTIAMSDGSLDITAGSGTMKIGSTGSVNTTAPVIDWTQSGGDLTFMGKFIHLGTAPNVTATYTMSGGTFTQTRTGGWGMVVGGDGAGTFHVDGFWDVPGVDREIDFLGGGMKVAPSGTLKFSIHDAIGTTLINVGGVNAANMLGMVDMDLVGYTPTMGQTFDLIKGATDYGALALSAEDAAAWSLSTNGDVLQATYVVPEPVSMLLLGLGALALRRRR